MVEGVVYRVHGSTFKVEGLDLRSQPLGLGISGLEFGKDTLNEARSLSISCPALGLDSGSGFAIKV